MARRSARADPERRQDVIAQGFARAAAAGSALALTAFTALLLGAPRNAGTHLLGRIHDVQARALFHGHWNLPKEALALEAFKIHGKYFTYFGIWPTLLRMPVLLVTDRFDGHLTIASMVIALAAALWSLARLHRAVRNTVREDAPISRAEWWAVAGFQVVIGLGSVVLFLGSRALVYHEMELWGIAGGLLTADAVVHYRLNPTVARACWCCGAATIALLSRPSTGFGAVVAVALVLLGELLRGRDPRRVAALVAAVIVPVVFYGAVNIARFGGPFSLPLDKQVFSSYDHQRQLVLADNHNSLFGAKFVPTTLLQYLRPDALRAVGGYPWVAFPEYRAHIVGSAVFDTLDRTSSIPASMPGLTALAVVGALVLLRPRRHNEWRTARVVWPAIVGGLAGTVLVLTIAFVTNRYLADFMPPLAVLAVVGFQYLVAQCQARRLRAATVAVVALCAASVWINFGLARVYQRAPQQGDPDYRRSAPPTVVDRARSSNIN